MAASYIVKFCDRMPRCRVSWPCAKTYYYSVYIENVLRKTIFLSYKMIFYLKTKFSSLKMNNITVIEMKAIAKPHGIEGYYKLRKAELIQKLEAHPDVNEQLLIPGLEIPRNTTRSVNISAILDAPILGDKTPVLRPTQIFIAKSVQKIKDCWNWLLNYIPPKPKVVDKTLKSFKNLIKK